MDILPKEKVSRHKNNAVSEREFLVAMHTHEPVSIYAVQKNDFQLCPACELLRKNHIKEVKILENLSTCHILENNGLYQYPRSKVCLLHYMLLISLKIMMIRHKIKACMRSINCNK